MSDIREVLKSCIVARARDLVKEGQEWRPALHQATHEIKEEWEQACFDTWKMEHDL